MQSRFDQVSLILLMVGSYEILPASLMKKLQRGNNFQFHLGGAQNWVFQVSILYTYARCQHDSDHRPSFCETTLKGLYTKKS